MNGFEHLIEYFEKELEKQKFGKKPSELYAPINYTLFLGGKRIRPILTLMACEMYCGDYKRALPQAIAIELFHNFTLIHDDIMDNADKRRGRQTLHIKYDVNTAILAGDNLMAIAYQSLLKDCKKNGTSAVEYFTQGLIEVCEGQSLDKDFEQRKKVSIDEYITMIEKKTAALAETCCSIGAKLGGGNQKEINSLRKYGKYLGLAFQIQDDLLDIIADEAEFGKVIGGDLIEGKKTYLLLKALEKSRGNNKKLVQKVIANRGIKKDQINIYKNLYYELKVIEEASQEVKRYTSLALHQLKNIKHEKAKLTLEWLAHILTDRKK